MNEKKKSQADKFRDAARKHETDDDEKSFDEKLKRIAETKNKPANEAENRPKK